MSEIKEELLEIVETTLIPQVEDYIEDLHEIIEKNEQTEETMEETRDMESFLVELQNIVLAVNENKMDDDQAKEVYDKIIKLIEEHN